MYILIRDGQAALPCWFPRSDVQKDCELYMHCVRCFLFVFFVCFFGFSLFFLFFDVFGIIFRVPLESLNKPNLETMRTRIWNHLYVDVTSVLKQQSHTVSVLFTHGHV